MTTLALLKLFAEVALVLLGAYAIYREKDIAKFERKVAKYITDFTDDRVINFDNVIVIPHLGASTQEAEDNCAGMAAHQIMDYIEHGNIVNSVNFPACYMGALNPDAKARVVILHLNIPTMLSKITGIMSDLHINIRDLLNKSKGDFAVTIMDIDDEITMDAVQYALGMPGIIKIRVI